MDINKLGTLLYGVPPFTNLFRDSTVLIGDFPGYNYMMPIPYVHIAGSRMFKDKNDKVARVCDEYIKASNDYQFYVVNIGGNVLCANIQDKLNLFTRSSYTENKYKYSLTEESGHKQLVVIKDEEEVLNLSLEDKTILYLVDEINKLATTGLMDLYATCDIDIDVRANTLELQSDVPFIIDPDMKEDYMDRVTEVSTKLVDTHVKHIGFIDGDFLTPYVNEDGRKSYRYSELEYLASFLAESGKHITITIPFANEVTEQKELNEVIKSNTLKFYEEYTAKDVEGKLSPYVSIIVASLNIKDTLGEDYISNCVGFYTGLLKSAKGHAHQIRSFLEVEATSNLNIDDDDIRQLSESGFIPITHDRFYINVHGNRNLTRSDYIANKYDATNPKNIVRLMSFNSNVLLVQDILRDLTAHFDGFFHSTAVTMFNKHPVGAKPEIAKHVEEILSIYKYSINDYIVTVDHVLDDSYTVIDYRITIELFIAGEIDTMTLSTTVM